jgi:hypothetical protein
MRKELAVFSQFSVLLLRMFIELRITFRIGIGWIVAFWFRRRRWFWYLRPMSCSMVVWVMFCLSGAL